MNAILDFRLYASPFGHGGCLRVDGIIEGFFRILGHPLGTSDGQQAWEALATLVALRLWSSRWRNRRVQMAIISDSGTALALSLQMKATGKRT